MKEETEISLRKKARENIRHAIKNLDAIGDFGTAARLKPILDRLVERRHQEQQSK